MSLGRRIARCFIVPCDERPEPKKKFIPNSNIEYEREIFDAHNNFFAYAQKGGNWVELRPAGRSKSGTPICSNDGDVSFETIQALSFPYAPSCGS